MPSRTPPVARTVRVWPLLVRIVHWSVAGIVLFDLVNEAGSVVHRWGGYLAAGLVVLRLLWGFFTPSEARWSKWFPTPSRLFPYLAATLRGRAPRTLGLNPVGGTMALLLWTGVLALGVTGWMMSTDAFWGEEWLEKVHEIIAWTVLGCACVHVTAVVVTSIRQRENLPKAMVTGEKRALDD